MIAFEIPSQRFSLPAGGEVARRRFVSINSNGEGISATAATAVVGASMNTVARGQVLEVADGLVMVEAAGAITAGAAVYSDASGKVAATGTTIVGTAITSATGAGEVITVKL